MLGCNFGIKGHEYDIISVQTAGRPSYIQFIKGETEYRITTMVSALADDLLASSSLDIRMATINDETTTQASGLLFVKWRSGQPPSSITHRSAAAVVTSS